MNIQAGRRQPPHIDIPLAWAEDRRLRPADIGVLVHLRHHGAASATEVARRLDAGPGSVQATLMRLAGLGYVEHYPHGRPPFRLTPVPTIGGAS